MDITPQKLTFQVGVDNSGLEPGLAETKAKIGAASGQIEQAAGKAGKTLDNLGTSAKVAGDQLNRSQQAYLAGLQRTIAAEQAGGRNTVEYQRKLAELRGVPTQFAEPLLKQLEAIQTAQAGATKGLGGYDDSLRKMRAQANLTANALRQVPAQFTDIVVSLAGGQAPLTVLLQQGGQLKDVFGGVGAAVKALSGYVLGLINPLTIVVGALAAIGFAYKKGSDETEAFNNGLILTGRAAGKTLTDLQDLSAEIAKSANVTKGAAAEALTLAVNAGLTGDGLSKAAEAAARLQKTVGVDLGKTIDQFKSLGEEPLKAAVKLNETTHFLTTATYEQIKALEDQGKKTDAVRLAQQLYADTVRDRTGEITTNLGYAEAAYEGILDMIKKVIDASLEIGRPSGAITDEAVLREARRRIAELEQKAAPGRGIFSGLSASDREELDLLKQREAYYQKLADAEKKRTEESAKQALQVRARVDFGKLEEASLSKQAQLTKALAEARETATRAGIPLDSTRFKTVEADLIKKYRDDSAIRTEKSQVELDAERIQAAFAKLTDGYKNGEKLLEAVRSAGLVNEREYYDTRRTYLDLASTAQVKAYDEEIARRRSARLTGADQLDNIKKITELEQKREKTLMDTSSAVTLLGIQEEAAGRARVQSYISAVEAQQQYLGDLKKRQDLEVELLSMGDRQRSRAQAVSQVQDTYARRIEDLNNARRAAEFSAGGAERLSPEVVASYDAQLQLLKNFQEEAVAVVERAADRKAAAEDDWTVGAKRALANYVDSVSNAAQQTESSLTNAFKSAEDAFVEFAKTGQLSFSDMADSIISLSLIHI